MAIIQCLDCGNKISSKAKTCQHCGYIRSKNDENAEQQSLDIKLSNKKRSLNYQAFIAMILFATGGFMWVWDYKISQEYLETYISICVALISIGMVWYAICRVWLFKLKNQS